MPAPYPLATPDRRIVRLYDRLAPLYDAVLLTETLELFSAADAVAVLAEIRRVLRPEGRLVVTSMERADFEDSWFVRAYEWSYRSVPGYGAVDCRPIYSGRHSRTRASQSRRSRPTAGPASGRPRSPSPAPDTAVTAPVRCRRPGVTPRRVRGR